MIEPTLTTAIPTYLAREHLQGAYVRAVVARAGASIAKPEPDVGADFCVSAVRLSHGKYNATGFMFFCQLKTSTTYVVEPDFIVFDMEAEDYNKLVEWEGTSNCYLILHCLPKDNTDDYLYHTEEQLHLRRCCYWLQIAPSKTNNTSKMRVRIPRSQMFTPEAVIELLRRAQTSN